MEERIMECSMMTIGCETRVIPAEKLIHD